MEYFLFNFESIATLFKKKMFPISVDINKLKCQLLSPKKYKKLVDCDGF